MNNNYILKIDNPCTEPWTTMLENGFGRYCKSCNKDVVDFSQLSDDDIIKYLSKTSDARICGRVEPHQLNRIIKSDISYKPKFNKLIAALFLFGAAKTAIAQTQSQPSQHQTSTSKNNEDNLKSITAQQKNEQDTLTQIIEGKVMAEDDKLPIHGVHIKIKGTNSGVFTNTEGKFKLFIPESLRGKKIELDFRYLGFKQLLVQMKPSDFKDEKEFKMCIEAALMGEVVIVSTKKKWWKFWKW